MLINTGASKNDLILKSSNGNDIGGEKRECLKHETLILLTKLLEIILFIIDSILHFEGLLSNYYAQENVIGWQQQGHKLDMKNFVNCKLFALNTKRYKNVANDFVPMSIAPSIRNCSGKIIPCCV